MQKTWTYLYDMVIKMDIFNFLCICLWFQLADVLRGDYDDVIGTYRIIDCRYPYEYEGGHVQVNILIFFQIIMY